MPGRARAAPSRAAPSRAATVLSADQLTAYEKASVEAHNKYRAMHGCPPLTLNRQLCKLATDWAQTLAKRNQMAHRPNNKYGENIYMVGGVIELNAERPVELWYNEIKDYNFAAGKFVPIAGHFTQLIWRDTSEVGVGVCTKGDAVWVVANYTPAGNVVDQFKQNVPPKR